MDWIIEWHGKRIEECSRDELIEALRYMSGRIRDLESPEAIRARSIGRVEMLRRGIRAA